MGSLGIVNIIKEKLFSFNSTMEENLKPCNSLSLMSDYSNYYQKQTVLLDLFGSGTLPLEKNSSEYPTVLDIFGSAIFPFENNSSEQFYKKKTDFSLMNLTHNFFSHHNIGASYNLSNFVKECVNTMSANRDMLLLPSSNLRISHMLCNSHVNKSQKLPNKNMNLISKASMDENPEKKSEVMLTVSVKNTSHKDNDGKGNANGYTLNVELSNRKTKELKKRSKKRRRRQKKNCHKDVKSVTKDQENIKKSSKPSHNSDSKSNNDVSFVLSVECKPQKSCNLMSSFIISVGSTSDDDSDWDCNSETDILTETEEFDFPGLLVANFSSTFLCSHPLPTSNSSASCQNDTQEEVSEFEAILVEVNKNWNESHKDINLKPKSPPKVSFVADDELVEVFLVEKYDRKGEWEIYATERLRFKRRIDELEKIISPCLTPEHRLKVYRQLTESNL